MMVVLMSNFSWFKMDLEKEMRKNGDTQSQQLFSRLFSIVSQNDVILSKIAGNF